MDTTAIDNVVRPIVDAGYLRTWLPSMPTMDVSSVTNQGLAASTTLSVTTGRGASTAGSGATPTTAASAAATPKADKKPNHKKPNHKGRKH